MQDGRKNGAAKVSMWRWGRLGGVTTEQAGVRLPAQRPLAAQAACCSRGRFMAQAEKGQRGAARTPRQRAERGHEQEVAAWVCTPASAAAAGACEG